MANAGVGAWAFSCVTVAILECAPIAMVSATGAEKLFARGAQKRGCQPVGNVPKASVMKDAGTICIFAKYVKTVTASPAEHLKRA